MKNMVVSLLAVSVLAFAVVMYLMIDRSALSVSLFKMFGYRKKEIQKLYLNGNFFVVALGALVGIPLSKTVMDLLFPIWCRTLPAGSTSPFPGRCMRGSF